MIEWIAKALLSFMLKLMTVFPALWNYDNSSLYWRIVNYLQRLITHID